MSAESKSDQDRWRELANLLGLPADGPSTVPASPPSPAQPPPRSEADHAPVEKTAESLSSERSIEGPGLEAGMLESKAEQQREEGRPRRGGRGRGRRADKAEAEATGTSAPAFDSTRGENLASGRSESDQARTKGRRGRRKSSTSQTGAAEAASTLEIDDEDLGDYAKWNLPSWEELIASLKRP